MRNGPDTIQLAAALHAVRRDDLARPAPMRRRDGPMLATRAALGAALVRLGAWIEPRIDTPPRPTC